MSIKSEVWGKSPKGKEVHKFTMTNAMGASVSVMEWGAICTSIIVPDAGGNMDDVALGFDTLEPYLGSHGCFGDTVGRYGNRIGAGKRERLARNVFARKPVGYVIGQRGIADGAI